MGVTDITDIAFYLLLVLFLLLSAFFSSSETAYAKTNKMRLRKSAENGSKPAIRAVRISDDYTRFLSTVLIGNNIVNIAFSSCLVVVMSRFGQKGENLSPVIATVLLLAFGEVIPKITAGELADNIVTLFSRPLRGFMLLFSPLVALVSFFVKKLSPIWTPNELEPEVTDEELVTILETIEEEGVFTEREGELIKSAIEFLDLNALDIYIPRVDVAAFDLDDDINTLLNNPDMLSFSRIPVYKESIDNIIGILSTKRLLKEAVLKPENKISIEHLLSPPFFVHKTRNISSILLEFKKTRTQMAIVVDEFGGTLGIITLEDILEEIVGEIFDESDDIELDVVPSGENTFIVDGGTSTEDFFEYIEYTPPDFESEYSTVGGWAIEMLDRFPVPGDSFSFDKLEITVLEAQAMRVDRLKIVLSK